MTMEIHWSQPNCVTAQEVTRRNSEELSNCINAKNGKGNCYIIEYICLYEQVSFETNEQENG
jgi:hypothetical protein